MKRTHLLAIPIDWITEDTLRDRISAFVASRQPHQITTVNPEFLVLSQTDETFRKALQASDLSLADGTGIVLAQTFFDQHPHEFYPLRLLHYLSLGLRFLLFPHSFTYQRLTGVFLAELLMEEASKHNWSVYLLGAGPGIAEQAAHIWQTRYPNLKIVGTSSANPDDTHIVETIRKAQPNILLVAYGAPKQDLFIATHKATLHVPVMVGVGGTFDYVAGVVPLAPRWVRRMGLEWLARLLTQPKRAKRIWRSVITFSLLVIREPTGS